jgi:hypothetical protein
MTCRINQNAAIAHLSALGFCSGDNVYLRFFYPSEDSRKATDKGRKLEAVFPNLPWKQIEQFQLEGRGVYFVVNDGGARDSEISAYRAIFYEHDHLSKKVSCNLWQQLTGLEPTIQVDTGGKSIHSYLCFPGSLSLPASKWSELQTDLLEYMDGDRALKNPSRVMRLAGGYHIHPGREPIQTTVINHLTA